MEQKNKKKSVFKIIRRVLLIILLVYIISVLHKYFILRKIHSETQKNISKDNYSMTIETTLNGNTIKTTCYYRNGRGKSVASNGVFKWTNQKYYFVVDEKNKTISDIDTENINEFAGVATKTTFANYIPEYFRPFSQKLKMVLSPRTIMWYSKVDGEPCYYIKYIEDGYKREYWISKKTYEPKKAIMHIANSKIEYLFDISFLNTRVEDTEFVEITGYTFIDSKTGEKKNAEEIFTDE